MKRQINKMLKNCKTGTVRHPSGRFSCGKNALFRALPEQGGGGEGGQRTLSVNPPMCHKMTQARPLEPAANLYREVTQRISDDRQCCASIILWATCIVLYVAYSGSCIITYRVVFLTGPPDFQYQNEKTCSANEELFYIENFVKNQSWLAATCFSFWY